MEVHSTITITVSRTEAHVVRLALALLSRDRRNAPDEARKFLPEDKRGAYIADAAEVEAMADNLSDALACALREGMGPT